VKSRLLRAEVALLGLSFLTVSSLRRELCARFRFGAPEPEREILDLLVRWNAWADDSANAITRNPRAWLQVLAELTVHGWLDDARLRNALVPPSLASFVNSLERSMRWFPGIDRRLFEAARLRAASPHHDFRLLILGADAAFMPAAPLLFAAARIAASCDAFIPLPRAGNEAIGEAW